MNKNTIIIISIVAIFIIAFLSLNGAYKNAIKKQETVNEAWANVQSAYQRRADLVPNLVATVKEAAENERGILTAVTNARAGISNAKTPQEMEMLGKEINSAINLAFEAYPQIRSTQNFSDLQTQLEGTENRINFARDQYNKAVKKYNSHIRGLFRRMAISILGSEEDNFVRREMFQATETAQENPDVNNLFNDEE
jgi:LemA protein